MLMPKIQTGTPKYIVHWTVTLPAKIICRKFNSTHTCCAQSFFRHINFTKTRTSRYYLWNRAALQQSSAERHLTIKAQEISDEPMSGCNINSQPTAGEMPQNLKCRGRRDGRSEKVLLSLRQQACEQTGQSRRRRPPNRRPADSV